MSMRIYGGLHPTRSVRHLKSKRVNVVTESKEQSYNKQSHESEKKIGCQAKYHDMMMISFF